MRERARWVHGFTQLVHTLTAAVLPLQVEMLGCWNCVAAVYAGRHYIARVQGQALNIGVFVDRTHVNRRRPLMPASHCVSPH